MDFEERQRNRPTVAFLLLVKITLGYKLWLKMSWLVVVPGIYHLIIHR